MSLLLDALKRAEDAKRAKADAAATPSPGADAAIEASAGKPSSPSPVPAFPELKLEEVDSRPADPVASTPVNPASPAVIREDTSADSPLSLEAVLNDPPTSGMATATTHRATAAFRAARINQSQQSGATDAAALTVTTPIPAALAPAEHEPASPEAAAQVASNREAVKNVFAVKQTAKAPARNTIAMIVVGVLVTVVAGGGWYVWTEMNRMTRPGIAKPAIPLAPPPPSTTASATTAPIAPAGQPVSKGDAPAPAPSKLEASAAAGSAVIGKPPIDIDAALPPLLPPPAVEILAPKSASVSKAVVATPREAAAKRLESLPEALAPAPTGTVKLKLASPAVSTIDPVLAAGYAALTAGDYISAQRHYADVLRQSPNNIDAHLGLAASAAHMGKPEDLRLASRHYQRALELDPRNSAAITGLVALSVDAGAQPDRTRWDQRESELSRLVAADPQSATARYLLGNLFAEQRRWSEAQQSFFEAARIAPDNGDYAYNLAVSLDHLGQSRTALTFYRRALAATAKVQFDKSAVERRIATLAATESAAGR